MIKLVLLLALFSCSSQQSLRSERMPAQQATLPSEFSVLIWNIYKGGKGQKFYREAKEIFPRYDLILLQETVFGGQLEEFLANEFSHQEERAISWGRNGVATLSTASATEVFPMKTKGREFFVFTPKASLATIYQMEEAELLVINIHMINFRETRAMESQLDQYSDLLERHKGPIIVAGDFNTWSAGRIDAVDKFLTSYGLKEIDFADSKGADPRAKFAVGVLDRLYTRGLKVLNAEVFHKSRSSDHYPFAVDLKLDSTKE